MRKWRFKDEEYSPNELHLRHWMLWLEKQPQEKHYGEVLYLLKVREKVSPLGPKIKNLLKYVKKELGAK